MLSGQHIGNACRPILRQYINAHMSPPAWAVQFLAHLVCIDVTAHVRDSIVGMCQAYMQW